MAAGREPADVLFKNARVVSVLSATVERTNVAVADGVIVGFGDYRAKKTVDVKGAYLSAGFFDSHVHIESTLLTPFQFARAVVPRGTTSVVADPHEIANVLGMKGLEYMFKASRGLPLDIYIALPSCVPATRLETSGAKLTAGDLKKFIGRPNVVGIGEVMDWPGVVNGRPDLLAKLALKPGLRVDGHAPGVTGKLLNAYVMGNISSDHESTTAKEAEEKLRAGLHIMIREGSGAKNLEELVKIITPLNTHRLFFCTDDLHPQDLLRTGHIDAILRKAVKLGVDPIAALQMATNNAPYYFRIPVRKGAVAVGYQADLVVLEDLKNFRAREVYKEGELVARDGKLVGNWQRNTDKVKGVTSTMHVKPFGVEALELWTTRHKARVIGLIEGQIVTKNEVLEVKNERGLVKSDVKKDILKLVVIERHKGTGNIGLGLVRGFGLKKGALASSVAHDSHNIIAVGVDDADVVAAIDAVILAGGGFAAVAGGRLLSMLKLPIAGLMSDRPAEEVVQEYDKLLDVAKELGCRMHDPFQTLSFLALPVIPELKLTDKGLVDVSKMQHVGLFV